MPRRTGSSRLRSVRSARALPSTRISGRDRAGAPLALAAATNGFCRPEDVARTQVPGGWRWSAPTCREAWAAHRVERLAPCSEAEAVGCWLDGHRDTGVSRIAVTFEGTAPEVAWPGWTRVDQLVMTATGIALPTPAALPLDEGEAGPIADWIAGHRRIQGEAYARALRWWHVGLARRGASTWVAWDGARPAAALTVVPGPDGLRRVQEVFTAPEWRRRGLARALLRRVLTDGGRVVIAADAGSPAARCYLGVGFEPVGKLVWFTRAEPG